MHDELSTLTNTVGSALQLADGRTLQVTPLKVRQLGPFARAVEPFIALIPLNGTPVDLLPIVSQHAEQAQLAVCIATGLTAEEVADWELDTFARAIGVVLAVNVDFFVQRLAPMIRVTLLLCEQITRAAAQQATPQATSTSSTSSSTSPAAGSTSQPA